jgi:hypothetical protein
MSAEGSGATGAPDDSREVMRMADVLLVALTLAFFLLAVGLIRLCETFIDQEVGDDGEPDAPPTEAGVTTDHTASLETGTATR